MSMAQIIIEGVSKEEKKQAYLDLYQATDNAELKKILLEKIAELEGTEENA